MNAPRLVPEKSNQQSKNHSTVIQPKTAGVRNACQAIVDLTKILNGCASSFG